MAIINEKNKAFNSLREYKSEGGVISIYRVKELIKSGEFWEYNGFDPETLHINQTVVMTKEGNCIRRLTPVGYVTIALKK